MTSLTRIAAHLGLVTVSICAALILGEGVVRLACRSCDPSGMVAFTQLADGTSIGVPGAHGRQVKNTGDFDVDVAFNQLGFRDPKSLQSSSANSLFVVGDSFAFGWGVEQRDRFSDQLSRLLGERVFNIASGAADFDGYQTLIRYAEGHGAHIGRLIVSVCMENDLHIYGSSAEARREDGDSRIDRQPLSVSAMRTWPFAAKLWLAEHSALRFAVTRAVHGTPWLKAAMTRVGAITPNAQDAAESETSDKAIRSSAERLHRLVTGRSAVVLVIPSRGIWVGSAAHREAVAIVHQSFIDQLENNKVDVIDLRSSFERSGNPMAFHFANDGHWNVQGHRIAAERLAEYFRAHR